MKIFFDATVGEPWVIALASFFSLHKDPKPLFRHIHEISPRGAYDNEWLSEIFKQDCIIITGDAGRRKPRLPQLCKENKKTHIIFSPTLQKSSLFNKARAIVVLWPEIADAFNHPKGSRFQIQIIDARHERFRMVEKN